MAHKKEIDGRNISRDVLENYRFRAIALREKGWKINEIAESFGLHRGSVSRWVTTYKRKGKDALKKRKAQGARPKLEQKEVAKIVSCLKLPATYFGFDDPLWNCSRVTQLIRKECKAEIHVSNVWRMLRSLNFTPQVPTRYALEENPKEVQQWLKKIWPKIKEHARNWRAVLYFEDESAVSLTPVLGRTWAPKGQTPIIKVTGNKGSIIVSSVISLSGLMLFRIEKRKIHAEEHIEFLQQILNHHPKRKIIVVEDKAPVHTAGAVKRFIDLNKKRFALYYLPSYAPRLNPDEKTWSYLKEHKLKAHSAQTKKELSKIVFAKMKSIQRQPLLIKSFFCDLNVT